MAADDLIVERPIVATVLVAVVATVAYAGLQVVMAGGIDVPQTAGFVVIFTVVYVGGNRALQQWRRDGNGDETTEETPD